MSYLKLWIVEEEVLHEDIEVLCNLIGGGGEVIVRLSVAVAGANRVVHKQDVGRLNLGELAKLYCIAICITTDTYVLLSELLGVSISILLFQEETPSLSFTH